MSLSNRSDYILAFLYACKKEPVESTIRLMKLLFLFTEKMKTNTPSGFYKFIPYLYGPCSFNVYKDLITLEKEKMISVNKNARWEIFTITKYGESLIEASLQDFPKIIEEIKSEFNSMPLMALLKYVYTNYPFFAKNTIIDTSSWGEELDTSSSTEMH